MLHVALCSEDCIIQYYRMLRNLSRSEAIFKYLEIVQSLPMYSLHYFEVKVRKVTCVCVFVHFEVKIHKVTCLDHV